MREDDPDDQIRHIFIHACSWTKTVSPVVVARLSGATLKRTLWSVLRAIDPPVRIADIKSVGIDYNIGICGNEEPSCGTAGWRSLWDRERRQGP